MSNLSQTEVEEMKRQMEEQMAANQRELEEMKKSYEERMKEGQADSMVCALWMQV